MRVALDTNTISYAMRDGATLVMANLREFQRVRGLPVTSWHDALG